MSTTLQLEFRLELPTTRPLVAISVAMVLADRGEDYVLGAIETGAIAWAWDIRGKSAAAREIRIWRESLLGWLRDPLASLRAPARTEDEAEVVGALFPHSRAEVRGTEVQRMFSCGHSHVMNLIADGLLKANSEAGPGPTGSPRITRGSVVGFLIGRRVM